MTTLTFKKDSEASDFASKLLSAHDRTQICYKYERDCEIEFWWEYKTDMCSDERIDEDLEKTKVIDGFYFYLDENSIEYGFK